MQLSQAELAEQLGIGRNAVRELEEHGRVGKEGKRTEMVLHSIVRLSNGALSYEFFTMDFAKAAQEIERNIKQSSAGADSNS